MGEPQTAHKVTARCWYPDQAPEAITRHALLLWRLSSAESAAAIALTQPKYRLRLIDG